MASNRCKSSNTDISEQIYKIRYEKRPAPEVIAESRIVVHTYDEVQGWLPDKIKRLNACCIMTLASDVDPSQYLSKKISFPVSTGM